MVSSLLLNISLCFSILYRNNWINIGKLNLMQETKVENIEKLQGRVDYQFSSEELLLEALTHKSFSNERPDVSIVCNERLEFLGDAVLDLVISQRTFEDYPDLPEGELTRVRAELVREKNLAEVARRFDFGSCIKMGRGERRSGGESKDSILANAVEAFLGALFLDGGYSEAQRVIENIFRNEIILAVRNEFDVDHKTKLQEFCQRVHHQTPDYQLISESGPDHQRHYTVEVHLKGKKISTGEGRSKKLAEQDAARGAQMALGNQL